MSREIKFRAWDGNRFHYWGFGVNGAAFTGPLVQTGAHLVNEQYTGLKDKNGKEIYEGDILSSGDEIGVIRFGQYEHRYHDGMLGFYLDCGELGIFDGQTAEVGKVIGNINENQELLK